MALIDPPIPKLGVTGAQPATDIVDALEDIRDEINGGLDNTNLAPRCVTRDSWLEGAYGGEGVWRTSSLDLNAILVGGSPDPLFPSFLYGQQTFDPGLTLRAAPDYPGLNVLRQWVASITYSKVGAVASPTVNDPTNELEVIGQQSAFMGLATETYFSATIPGSDGIRTRYTQHLAGYDTWATSGSTMASVPWDAAGAVGGTPFYWKIRATGASLANGFFTIHNLTFRYRDMEF